MSTDPTAIEIATDPIRARMRGTTYHGGLDFDVPYMTEIDTNLWQGGHDEDMVLPENIRHVVSLYPWGRYRVHHNLDSFLEVRLFDSADAVDREHIVSIARWARSCRTDGPTLVHCQAGLNRSSLIVGLVLMMDGANANGAINRIRSKRSPACLCNPTFEGFLRGFLDV